MSEDKMSGDKCKWCGGEPAVKDEFGVVCAKCWLKGKQKPRGRTNKC